MSRWPRIPLGLRLFLLFFVLVAMTAYFVSKTVIQEVKPAVRQATEETLVDVANLLAVLAQQPMAAGNLNQSRFAELLSTYGQRQPQGRLWEFGHKTINHRIYITDRNGIVVADSWQQDIGQDFSRWNDVYLTLRGQYGARSTALDPDDPLSTVMHVAAPIMDNGAIIGSVTVAKANRSVQPFIDLSKQKVAFWMLMMTLLVLLAGALVAWRINTALSRLIHYANHMGQGKPVTKPRFRIFYEYGALSDALEQMRNQLDGKQYVEDYVQTLTHELKSPLSAIRGASEILQAPLPADKQNRFAGNIEREARRMQSLIDQLLQLARLEKRPQLEQVEPVMLASLVEEVIASAAPRLTLKQLQCQASLPGSLQIQANRFLLRQALFNLMDNALDFAPSGASLSWQAQCDHGSIALSLFNQGPAIPDYALPRVRERFFSLARPDGAKSSGLGLHFVEQVATLHGGELQLKNHQDGVLATLRLPSP
ncbi:two-component system sensor histidine kinase CreC [Ferrimonas kyonanensis]|uniref:two-component system sensor histidine kinase CreC n=1 Tax=Ferrimonas kyonanensis TaxID=364763 RepID=UPI0004194370|nr:two-component system sensor histidine kinase CreC [Ferrimonas kyonanensis]